MILGLLNLLQVGISDSLIHISVGIGNVYDLIEDLEQVFVQVEKTALAKAKVA